MDSALNAGSQCADKEPMHTLCGFSSRSSMWWRRSSSLVLVTVVVLFLNLQSAEAATKNASLSISATVASSCNVLLVSGQEQRPATVDCTIPQPYQLSVTTELKPHLQISAGRGVLTASLQRGGMTTLSNTAIEGSAPPLQTAEFVASPSVRHSCAETEFTSELIQVSVIY
jgi:hypothetical protein